MALDKVTREQVRVLVVREGTLLLLRSARSPNPSHVGKWEVPGGFVLYEESPRHAALREVKEETGLACKILFELHPFFLEDARQRVIVFCAIVAGGRMRISAEHSDYQWVPMDRIAYLTDIIYHEKLIEYVREAKEFLAHARMTKALSV